MELHEALGQIEAIQRQMARTEKFRGYAAWPTAFGAALAAVAAAAQPLIVPQPDDDLASYLTLWLAVAAMAGGVAAGDAWRRHLRDATTSGVLVRLACEQFLPCVVAGALVTATIVRCAPSVAWMLPGLWAVTFSLGLFASWRLLPGPIAAVAAWYLVAGCVCLALGPTGAGLAPWTMAMLFGVGQSMLAAILAMQPREELEPTETGRGV
jgi:hypothetical protein